MNVLVTCMSWSLFAGLSYLYSIDLLSVLPVYVAAWVLGVYMPEPEDPRRTPQGVSYADLKHFVNADGQHLFCRYWEPDAPPRSVDEMSCEV